MSKDFVVDIETLDTESSAVLLSVGIVAVDFEEEFTFKDLVDNGLFVKFDARSQGKRTVSQSTLDWWKSQSREAFESQVIPSEKDVSLVEGFNRLREYMQRNDFSSKSIVWSRGVLDVMVLTSIAQQLKIEPLFQWWRGRDVRTAVDILSGSDNGYAPTTVEIPKEIFIAHDPMHDAARDAILLRYCEQS